VLGGAFQITAGANHTCAILEGNAVHCWGQSNVGQLGLGRTNNLGDDEPIINASAVLLGSATIQISAGDLHTCALSDTGTVKCWGANASKQLGRADTSNFGDAAGEIPSTLSAIGIQGDPIVQVSAGGEHTCVLTQSSKIFCWGEAANGRLGNQSPIDSDTPVAVIPF
jgi:hypothetical protein